MMLFPLTQYKKVGRGDKFLEKTIVCHIKHYFNKLLDIKNMITFLVSFREKKREKKLEIIGVAEVPIAYQNQTAKPEAAFENFWWS